MLKFRKKPVDVEATQIFQKDIEAAFQIEVEAYNARKESYNERWGLLCGTGTKLLVEGAKIYLSRGRHKQISAYIETLEGRMQISDGDWIIKGVAGEFYPCKPDIFKLTYEKI